MSGQIERKVKNFIKEHDLIKKGDELVVGVSGGADSMMLLHFLYTHKDYYNIDLKIAHVHHGIREEAELDAELVEATCKKWKLPYYRHNCNIKKLSKELGMSEEEVGRKERYSFFISLLNEHGKIVTAHNMNDQAETLIMRFLRGTDINGLGGIAPKRGTIIRPLLGLQRSEIEGYCKKNNIHFRDDHTNFVPIYTRNKIRLECIPYIEDNINPNVISMLAEHSHTYRETEVFLKEYTQELFKKCADIAESQIVINIKIFASYAKYIQKRVLFLAIEKFIGQTKDISLKHIQSIVDLSLLQTGKEVSLPYKLVARKEYDEIILKKAEDDKLQTGFDYVLELGENYIKEINTKIILTKVKKETIEQKNEKMYTKYIDYGKIKDRLQIRTRLPQDYIMTLQGTKKIKKLFIDEKVPQAQREQMPLLTVGSEVIWILGGRLNTNYYITNDTLEVLEIKLQRDN